MRVEKDKKVIKIYETVGPTSISIRDAVRAEHFKTILKMDEQFVITIEKRVENESK